MNKISFLPRLLSLSSRNRNYYYILVIVLLIVFYTDRPVFQSSTSNKHTLIQSNQIFNTLESVDNSIAYHKNIQVASTIAVTTILSTTTTQQYTRPLSASERLTPTLVVITNLGEILQLDSNRHPDEYFYVNDAGEVIRFVPPKMPARNSHTIGPESHPNGIIIGNRHIVTDTTIMPYLWVVNLEVTFPNGDFGFCSGWLYNRYSIATAGHCVYDASRGGWVSNIVATPGRDATQPPYPFPSCSATRVWTNNVWLGMTSVPANRPFYDWGGVNVECSYEELGHFGIVVSEPPVGQQAIVSGYPCQDIPVPDLGKQFTSEGQVLGLERYLWFPYRIVTFNTDVVGCNSGSPVYQSNNFVYATVTQAYVDVNKGTLITNEVFEALISAIPRHNKIYLPLVQR